MSLRARAERGSAVVIAILIVLMMLLLTLGTFTFVQGQQKATGDEHVMDSSYNLADAGMESSAIYLASKFPSTTALAYGKNTAQPNGGPCSQTSNPAADNCPDPANVTAAFTQPGSARQPDYAGAPTWTTSVYDNGGSIASFYRESLKTGQPAYDANGDGKVWLRSEAIVQARKKILVAQVAQQSGTTQTPLPFPMSAVWAADVMVSGGSLDRLVVDSLGSGSIVGNVNATCASVRPAMYGPCPGLSPSRGQITPWAAYANVEGYACKDESGNDPFTGAPPTASALKLCSMSDVGTQLKTLRTKAQAAGTYYAGCCASCPPTLTGKLIFIENGPCSYTGTSTYNSTASPGMVVVADGGAGTAITVGGSSKYYGVIWDANVHGNGTMDSVIIDTTAQVIGGVIIDTGGELGFYSTTQPALRYDAGVFYDTVTTATGAPKIVPGTVREVPPSS
jgi:hypothetical protein